MDSKQDGFVEQLGDRVGAIAARTAANFCIKAGRNKDVDVGILQEELRLRVNVALDEGLRDAKRAVEAGMTAVAVATLEASVRLAAVAAARAAIERTDAKAGG